MIHKIYFSIIILALLAFPFIVFAQVNKELARQLVEIGDEILNSTQAFEQAREQYLAALESDPNNIRANFMTGRLYLVSVNKGRAKQYFLKTYDLDPDYSFDLLYKIGLAYHYELSFNDAISYYNQYIQYANEHPDYSGENLVSLKTVERKINECGIGKELVASPRKVSIVNLGSNINSEFDDYAPVLNNDETLLIFTSRRRDGNVSEDVHTDNFPFEDIFFTVRGNDGTWSEAANIGTQINTPSHDSNLALSKDGTALYIYNSDINNGDIFMSVLQSDGGWSQAERLPEPVNSEYNENGVTLTEDGQWLYFSSNRPGGSGDFDIYVSERNNTGGWKRPRNLGPVINTEYDEEGPFICCENKTLYFSSSGGRGMGGFDIYKSDYDTSSDTWGLPQNLGYPINTPDEDVHFSPTVDGYRAYYATTREDGFGFTDIYEITFIDDKEKIEKIKKPDLLPVTVLIKVIDADTEAPLDAKVSLKVAGPNIMIPYSGNNGTYEFLITDEKRLEYELSAEMKGFAYYNDKVTLPGAGVETVTVERVIRLSRLVKGYSKVLRNLYFDFNKTILKDESYTELNKLEKMMSENPGMQIGMVGYTDIVGTEKYNIELSLRRALTVKIFLVSKGIDTRRIKTGGLGSRFPLASNDDEKEGRELNRRVEMVILSK